MVRYSYRPTIRQGAALKHRNTRCHRSMMAVLTEAREAAGMSLREVSRKLKRPENFAHLVESGERTLSVCEFIEYARAVEADPAELIRQVMA